ncbi:MAG: DUF5689 domain-containing protein [Alistipes sp.]
MNKNLFKLLFGALFLTAAVAFTGCSDDPDPAPGNVTLAVNPNALGFDKTGGAKSFEITTEGRWEITGHETASWCQLSATSGRGNQAITVTVGESTDARNVTLNVAVYTTIFGIEKKVDTKPVVITQTPGGDVPSGDVIYLETFGEKGPSGSPYTYVDQYDGWAKTGTGAEEVTYTGPGSSLRQSGKLSAGYPEASGKTKLFLGSNSGTPGTLIINKIKIDNKVNLCLNFGGSYSKNNNGTYDNVFYTDKFHVSLSADGTTWSTPIVYTTATADAYWVYATANFTLSKAVTYLYVRYVVDEASVFAIDDAKLTEGVGGPVVDLTAPGPDPEPGEATVITIPEIIAKLTPAQVVLDEAADRFFEAVVVTDAAGGNVNANNLQLMTPGATTANNGITLYGSGQYTNPKDPAFTFLAGDKVKVTLKKGQARIVNYKGLYEVTGSKDADWVAIEKIGTTTLSSITITADKLAEFQGMPVAIANATAPATAAIWSAADKYGIHQFSVNGTTFGVFVQASMPGLVDQMFTANSNGTIKGYASVNKDNAQICPQSAADVAPFMGAPSTDPIITGVDPTSLAFSAAGETKSVNVQTANADACTLSATSDNAQFTASVTGKVVSVVAPANTTAAAINGVLTIKLMKDGAAVSTKTVALSQAKKSAGGETTVTLTNAEIAGMTAQGYGPFAFTNSFGEWAGSASIMINDPKNANTSYLQMNFKSAAASTSKNSRIIVPELGGVAQKIVVEMAPHTMPGRYLCITAADYTYPDGAVLSDLEAAAKVKSAAITEKGETITIENMGGLNLTRFAIFPAGGACYVKSVTITIQK